MAQSAQARSQPSATFTYAHGAAAAGGRARGGPHGGELPLRWASPRGADRTLAATRRPRRPRGAQRRAGAVALCHAPGDDQLGAGLRAGGARTVSIDSWRTASTNGAGVDDHQVAPSASSARRCRRAGWRRPCRSRRRSSGSRASRPRISARSLRRRIPRRGHPLPRPSRLRASRTRSTARRTRHLGPAQRPPPAAPTSPSRAGGCRRHRGRRGRWRAPRAPHALRGWWRYTPWNRFTATTNGMPRCSK